MGTNYDQLNAEERATLMVMKAQGCKLRAIARSLHPCAFITMSVALSSAFSWS